MAKDYDLEEKKAKFAVHPQRMNLLYQWVKQGSITLKQFEGLIEYNNEIILEAYTQDEDY